jgi:mannosyltransferase OCH1-like enzyme
MIEKNIFQTFINNKLPDEVVGLIQLMANKNPEYQYYFYSDEDILDFIQTHYSSEIFEAYRRLQIGAAKADFWRYLILYKYGGIYLDIDSHISIDINSFLNFDDKAIITREGTHGSFVQWCLMMCKGHPILKNTIENVTKKIYENTEKRLNYITGPPVMSEVIEKMYSHLGFNLLYDTNDNLINAKLDKNLDDYARFIGVDFNNSGFIFKHQYYYMLYKNKQPWTEEQKIKPVILKI